MVKTANDPSRLEEFSASPEWLLKLYVAGQTPKSISAFSNLKRICEKHLKGKYQIEIIDLSLNPTLAKKDEIIAVPTLVRRLPEPVKKIIGNLAEEERVLVGLNLQHCRPISPEE